MSQYLMYNIGTVSDCGSVGTAGTPKSEGLVVEIWLPPRQSKTAAPCLVAATHWCMSVREWEAVLVYHNRA